MNFLRYSTASQEIQIGQFVSSTDGATAQTALSIANTDIKLFKEGATTQASKNSGGATHIANGYYYTVLDATDTGTLGMLEVTVNVSGALGVKRNFTVIPAMIYDSLILGTDRLDTNVTHIADTSQTARDIGASVLLSSGTGTGQVTLTSGRVNADITHINTSAVSTSTAQLGVNVVNFGGSAGTFASGRPEVNTTHFAGTAATASAGIPEVKVNNIAANAITATSIAADAITAAKIAADAIGASELAADAVTEIQSGLATASALSTAQTDITTIKGYTDDIGVAGAGLTAIPWNASWDAEVQSEVQDAIEANNLDHLVKIAVDTDFATTVHLNSVIGHIADNGTTATFDRTTDSLEALQAEHDVTQGKVDAVDDFVDTEVAAIKTVVDAIKLSTDNLPSDPADASVIAGLISGLDTKLDTIDNFVDTEVAAIKTVTDKVDTALVLDGAVYQFTANALELAPTGGSAPTAADIADAVWEEDLTDHSSTVGSVAEALGAAGSAGDPWATALPGAYGSGSAGKIIGDNINATISSRASQTSVDDVPTNAELATALGTADDATLSAISSVDAKIDIIDTNVDSVKAKTDSLTFTTANRVDSTAITVSDKTGYALSSGGVQAIWDALTSALTTSGSIGKWIVDKLDVVLSTRLASASYTAPDNSSITSIKTKTDQLTFGTANRVDAQVYGIQAGAVTASALASDAITDAKVASDVTIASVTGAVGSVTGAVGSVTGNVGGNVTGSVGSVATGGITAASIATDAIDADALASDAVTEIQSGLATASSIAALNNLSQANVRTAIGLASANLDTQLDALPTNAELATALASADDATLAAISALNNVSTAQVQTAATAALNAYDPPTRAEATSDKDAILTVLGIPNLGDIASDIADVRAGVDNVETDTQDIQLNLSAVKAKTDDLTFTVAGQVDANVQYVNDTQVTGTGESGDEWGPL